ncbi:P-loop containing nucleoside triphosphate hydrolase protein [Ilyonectria destructans]|nr:P-loop containing nucleoside triphosphate hydrolase protein [Ilyonectria destructans]
MTTITKDLYRESQGEPWQEWAPADVGINSKSTPDSARFSLIVRREKVPGGTNEPVLALHSTKVQSPLIKRQLEPVFSGYRGINTNLKALEFRAPFREFFYRWEKFEKANPGEDNGVEKLHYKLLADIISTEIRDNIDQVVDLLRNQVISFDYVWALFEPGAEVYTESNGLSRLYLLDHGRYIEHEGAKSYHLSCRFIDADGEAFGWKKATLVIDSFQNVKSMLDLDVIPSHLHPGMDAIRNRLTERGRNFEKLNGIHHKAYSGAYQLAKPIFGAPRKQHADDERIVIDSRSFSEYNDDHTQALSPLADDRSLENIGDHGYSGTPIPISYLLSQRIIDQMVMVARGKETVRPARPKGKHYALCTNFVRGFCLEAKKWAYLEVESIRDISWNVTAFDRLVLQGNYKRVIKAFVEVQMSGLDDFDDVIKGKGRGMIMLLSGEPGTGKTLTSESVAETMRKPLYGMSAGELGDDASEVEQNLHRVLELSARWGAVLLLDECDVFLELSIFLRLLEYYEGVMFLTTNRVSSFDPAFESRIHLTINYPKLDSTIRLQIWKTFAKRDLNGLSDDDLEELAEVELNGRQIKNVIKTARSLALSEKSILTLSYVQDVLKIKGVR